MTDKTQQVLDVITKSGPVGVRDIMRATGLKLREVGEAIRALEDKRLLRSNPVIFYSLRSKPIG